MKKKFDCQWLIWAILLGIAVLASSCSEQVKYKGKLQNGATHIEHAEPGFSVGDTIVVQSGYRYRKMRIDTILK